MPETTLGEARTIADLAAEQNWGHITVATSRFHTTRARALFRQCLDDVSVVGAPPPPDRSVPLRRHIVEGGGTILAWTVHRAC